MKNFSQKGITFIELLIVIAIIIILIAVVSPQFSKVKNLQILKGTGEDVVSLLRKARSETLASLNSTEYGVHFSSNQVVLFSGTTYNPNSASNQIDSISSPATISAISLTGGAVDVYFNRLSGTASKTGTITISISSDASLTKTITISGTGVASIN